MKILPKTRDGSVIPDDQIPSIHHMDSEVVIIKPIKDFLIKETDQHLEGLKMLDTIRVRFNEKLDTAKFRKHGWTKATKEECANEHVSTMFYKVYDSRNGNKVKVIYVPCDYSHKPNLAFEFSLPKILWGNNYQIWSNEVSIAAINSELKKITDDLGISQLDVMDGVLTRIDIAFNWKVNSRLKDYIKYLSKVHYTMRKRDVYLNPSHKAKKTGEDNGVSFTTRHTALKAYDKYKEADAPESRGVLRLELSIAGPDYVGALFGKKRAKFSDIRYDVCSSSLQEEIEILGLDHPIVCKKDVIETLKNMVANGSITKGMMQKLYGFITLAQDYPNLGNKNLAELLMIKPGKVSEYRKTLADAGIHVLDDLTEELPALSLDNPEPFKNGDEVISNTTVAMHLHGDRVEIPGYRTIDKNDFDSIRSLIAAYSFNVRPKGKHSNIKRINKFASSALPWPSSSEKNALHKEDIETSPEVNQRKTAEYQT